MHFFSECKTSSKLKPQQQKYFIITFLYDFMSGRVNFCMKICFDNDKSTVNDNFHSFHSLVSFYRLLTKLQDAFYRLRKFKMILTYRRLKLEALIGSLWEAKT